METVLWAVRVLRCLFNGLRSQEDVVDSKADRDIQDVIKCISAAFGGYGKIVTDKFKVTNYRIDYGRLSDHYWYDELVVKYRSRPRALRRTILICHTSPYYWHRCYWIRLDKFRVLGGLIPIMLENNHLREQEELNDYEEARKDVISQMYGKERENDN